MLPSGGGEGEKVTTSCMEQKVWALRAAIWANKQLWTPTDCIVSTEKTKKLSQNRLLTTI